MADKTQAQVEAMRFDFSYHPPEDDEVGRITKLRSAMKLAGEVILENTGPGREQSLAMTNLQQALMWANASVVLEGARQRD